MPDTALDTEAVPFRSVPAGIAPVNEPPPDQQVAQVERGVPAGDAPVNAPPPPEQPARAMDTGTPPTQTQAAPEQPAAPGGLSFVERPDVDDQRDAKAARDAEVQRYQDHLLEHQAPYRPLVAPDLIDVKQLPQWQQMDQLFKDTVSQMTPRERNEAQRQLNIEKNRMIAETNAKNRAAQQAYLQQQHADMAKIDGAHSGTEATQKLVDLVDTARQGIVTEKQTLLQSDKPDDKKEGDYTLKVSPLGTMKPGDFNTALAGIASLNGQLTPRQVAQYGLVLGSPVDRDQKTGALLPGVNTLNGKRVDQSNPGVVGMGATAFRVVGREGRANWLVEMPDGNVIRVPPTVYSAFADARLRGYGVQKKWWGDRRQAYIDAGKDDWATRQVKGAVGYVKEHMP